MLHSSPLSSARSPPLTCCITVVGALGLFSGNIQLYDLPLGRSLTSGIKFTNAGMRRPLFQKQVARAITHQPRRSLISRCGPELTSSTSAEQAETPSLRRKPPPFHFETGLALYAKRAPRPFPPPFLSPPSGSFSDPLSTHHRSRDRRAFVNGELIRGYTNGDDAVYASDNFIGANDGVGAWSTRPGGHAGSVYFSSVLEKVTTNSSKSLGKTDPTFLGSRKRDRCQSTAPTGSRI